MTLRRKAWRPESEIQLGASVVQWLESQGWDVYQEVMINGMRADVVALYEDRTTRRKDAWIIECKKTFSFEVVAQAWRWRQDARWSSVAIPDLPKLRLSPARRLAEEVLYWKGIGMIPVGPAGVIKEDIRSAAPNHRADSYDVLQTCMPEHKTAAPAGTNRGGYHTTCKATLAKIEAFVRENPGVDIKLAAAHITDHHWGGKDKSASFVANVSKLLQKGVVKGFEGKWRLGAFRLYPVDSSG